MKTRSVPRRVVQVILTENMNDYERREVRLSSRKRSYMRVIESDEESSTDKSKKSRSPVHTNPPSKKNLSVTGEATEKSEYESDYESSDDYAPNPESETSIGKPLPTNEEAGSEYEANSEEEFSNLRARMEIPDLNMNYLNSINEELLHTQPLIRAAWAGAFCVKAIKEKNIATFDGLKGCVSSKACPQARLVAEQLPASIKWEKLPKWCVWPKSFERREGPTDDDIALFFFPSLAKHEGAYESLLFDPIRGDLALRTVVMGSELLLFTSVDLPPLFTRFQGKLYLWGVFKGNQPPIL